MPRVAILSALVATLLAGCAAQTSPSGADLPSAPDTPPTQPASVSRSTGPSEPIETSSPAGIQPGSMVVTRVSDLTVRAEPALYGKRLGVLPVDEAAFVADGPVNADGHTWYQLASDSPCPEPDDTRFHCTWWMGWVAGAAEDGGRWLKPTAAACPSRSLDVTTYLSMTALHRLSCFGDAAWTLRGYMAPVGGDRGGTSIFSTEPAWLDAWGTVIFPQLEEREDDGGNELFMYAHPDLGCSFGGRNAACAFAPFVGQWIEIEGHLDDPAAATCMPIYNPQWLDSLEEPIPPLPDVAESVMRCRSLFVATAVRAAQ